MTSDFSDSIAQDTGAQSADRSAVPAQSSMARIISADQQEKAFRSARRHTVRVRLLKLILPLVAIGIVSGFVFWVLQKSPAPVEVSIDETSLKQDELVMKNPKLNGYGDGQTYEVVADRALQKVATPNIINLEKIIARVNDDKDQWANVTADFGIFDQTKETLELTGGVDVTSSIGYSLRTDEVGLDMKKGYMQTRKPVRIQSKDIILAAEKLEAIQNGEQIRFTGNVTLRIDGALLEKGAMAEPGSQTEAAQ